MIDGFDTGCRLDEVCGHLDWVHSRTKETMDTADGTRNREKLLAHAPDSLNWVRGERTAERIARRHSGVARPGFVVVRGLR